MYEGDEPSELGGCLKEVKVVIARRPRHARFSPSFYQGLLMGLAAPINVFACRQSRVDAPQVATVAGAWHTVGRLMAHASDQEATNVKAAKSAVHVAVIGRRESGAYDE
jgi:hypothetical protein